MEWMVLPLKRYFEFSGRSRRKEYWMFVLFLVILTVVAMFVDNALGYGQMASDVSSVDGYSASASISSSGPATIIVLLGLLIPGIAVTIRRLHDTDRSGWMLLLGFIPLVGAIVLLVFYCLEGTAGPNRFGEDPKGRASAPVA